MFYRLVKPRQCVLSLCTQTHIQVHIHTQTQANFRIHFSSSSSILPAPFSVVPASSYVRPKAGVAERLCFSSYFWAQVDTRSQSNTSTLPRWSCHSGAQMFQVLAGVDLSVSVCAYMCILVYMDALMLQTPCIDVAEKKTMRCKCKMGK